MKKAETHWDILSSPLLLQCTLLQAHKHIDKYPCKILIVVYLTHHHFIPHLVLPTYVKTWMLSKEKKKIPREKRQHTSIYKAFKYIWEQSMAFLFVLTIQKGGKNPSYEIKSAAGSWILLPASFSQEQKCRSRARSSPYPQVLPNTCLPLKISCYKLSEAAFIRVTSTGPSGGRDRPAASGSDNGRQLPFTISFSSLLPACKPSHPPESLDFFLMTSKPGRRCGLRLSQRDTDSLRAAQLL